MVSGRNSYIKVYQLSLYIFIYILYGQFLQIGATGAEYIADMLKYNSTISTLDLRANGLRDEVYTILVIFLFLIWWIHVPHTDVVQGAICLARSLKVVNEALTSLNLGFNEIRVWNNTFTGKLWNSIGSYGYFIASCCVIQDEGAFSIAQALKSNEDVRLASLNLMNNFLTKLGQVIFTFHIHFLKCFRLFGFGIISLK